jgi:hypothetical protein
MRKAIIYQRVTFVTTMVLLALLVAVQLLPLAYNESSIISQAAFQSTRAQRLSKDAMVLAYRPVSEHAQAISEIQNTIPAWEQEQGYLLDRHNADIESLILQAQPDFVAMDTATKKLLSHPSDQTQAIIIIQHERNYSLLMQQVSALIQNNLHAFQQNLVVVQCSLSGLIASTMVILFILQRKRVKKGLDNG